MLRRILLLLTRRGSWRPGHGVEALHLFYDGVDLRADHEIEEVFAQDEVPAGLHFRDLEETELVHELDLRTFEEWLTEGRHNCDIAQAVLHAWTSTLRGSQDDTLHDLFSTLVAEFAAAKDDPDAGRSNMQLLDLSRWVLAHCQFTSVLKAANAEDRASEIAEWIAEEIAVVSAYTSVWRGSSTLEGPPASDVTEDVWSQAARRVFPWPGISESPVPETTDGRIVKSHPLTFPAGCGDLRQPRLRTDFHPLEWTQHIFRYFDGRVVSSLRGQRAVWACFNTAMRQLSHSAGALLHKRSNVQALTKADLKAYIESRETLVSQLGVFGSELPSTAMQWKREGNELQWIVRQMSWLPPWTKAGLAETRKDLRRLGSYVKPTQKSSPCKRRARRICTRFAR